jgi:hypothetical protein
LTAISEKEDILIIIAHLLCLEEHRNGSRFYFILQLPEHQAAWLACPLELSEKKTVDAFIY